MKIILKDYKLLSKEEHKKLLVVRNLPEVRSGARIKDIIPLKSHLEWVYNLGSNKKYYAIFINNELQGGINWFYINKKDIEWGLFLGNHVQPFISSIVAYVFLDRVFDYFNINKLVSEITKDNESAYRFSINFGMKVIDTNEKYYKLILTKEQWYQNKNSRFMKTINKRLSRLNIEFMEDI